MAPLICIQGLASGTGGVPPPGPQYVTVFGSHGLTPTAPSQDTGLNDNGFRLHIKAASFVAVPDDVTKIKLTFCGGQSGGTEGLSIGNCYIGHKAGAGNVYDTSSMTQVTFSGGSSGFSISTNTNITSDEITFAYDGTSDLIVAAYFNSSGADQTGRHGQLANGCMDSYYKSNSDMVDTDDLTPSGFGAYIVASDRVRLVSKVHMYGDPTDQFLPIFAAHTTFSAVNGTTGNTRTFRMRIAAKFLENIPAAPTRVKLRLGAAETGAEGLKITKAYVGHASGSGDAYDAADLVQVLFSGVGNVTMAVNTQALSDEAAWVYDGTSDIIISFYMNDSANDAIGQGNADGHTVYISSSATDEAATLNATTGYGSSGTRLGIIKQILLAEDAP